jgi:CBS domain-containing protein
MTGEHSPPVSTYSFPVVIQKQVVDFMQTNPTVIHQTDSVRSALKAFKQAATTMLPVVNEDRRCEGWLRLDFTFDKTPGKQK